MVPACRYAFQCEYIFFQQRPGMGEVSTRKSKYTDRQKRKPAATLMVSIPRSLISVPVSTGLYLSPCPIRDTCFDFSDTPSESSLTVSFPLAQFIVIRGFSLASALVEQYKVTQKKTTQK